MNFKIVVLAVIAAAALLGAAIIAVPSTSQKHSALSELGWQAR